MKYLLFFFAIFSDNLGYQLDPLSLSGEEIKILNDLGPYIVMALKKASQLAAEGAVISNNLKDTASQQIIPWDIYNNSTNTGRLDFPHVAYLAITSDYCVVLRFNDFYDYRKYDFSFTYNQLIYGYSRNSDPYDITARKFPRLFGASIVWIPQITPTGPSVPSSAMFETATASAKISIPTGSISIPGFVAYSSIGQEVMQYHYFMEYGTAPALVTALTNSTLINNTNTGFAFSSSNVNKLVPRAELNWCLLNKQNPFLYSGSYANANDVPKSIIYNNKDFGLHKIYNEIPIKWMPTSEFGYSQFYDYGTTQADKTGSYATLAKKALRSYLKTPELTTPYYIAYNYLPSADYFKNFYGWNPKYLDDMRNSVMANTTSFDGIYPQD